MKENIGAVLTVISGRFLCKDISELYKILNSMTDSDELTFTHQLPEMSDLCKPVLLEKYPEMAYTDELKKEIDKVNSDETLDTFLVYAENRFGKSVELPKVKTDKLTPFDHLPEKFLPTE